MMPIRTLTRVAAGALAVLATGCGGKSPTNPSNPGGSSGLTATIDGAAFVALPTGVAAVGSANGTFSIAGGTASGTGLALNAFNIAGPGTYPMGVGPSVAGAIGSISAGGSAWSSALSGNSGTITFTTVSSTRIVGTFAFTATGTANASSTRSVTNGAFDIPVNATANIAVAPNAGSKFTATINGATWNAATVVMGSRPSSGTLTLSLSNISYQMVVTLSGYTGVGTYALATGVQRTMFVTNLTTFTNWGGPGTASTGSFVVTSSTASRIAGTLDVTLPPSTVTPGTGNLRLVGTFDVGIP